MLDVAFFSCGFPSGRFLDALISAVPNDSFGANFAIYEPKEVKGGLLSKNLQHAFPKEACPGHGVLHALRLGHLLTLIPPFGS